MRSPVRTIRLAAGLACLCGLVAAAHVERGLPVDTDLARTQVAQGAPEHQADGTAPAQARTSDSEAVARGLVLYGFYCMNCHGGDGRGGRDGGSDLRESEMLELDDGGKTFAEFLPVGRPEQRMPATPLPEADIADLWAFVRVLVTAPDGSASAGAIAGDAAAGARHFKTGGCTDCHSAAGDLATIGSRHDVKTIHARLLEPPAAGAAAKAHAHGADAARRGHIERVKALPEQAVRDLAVHLVTLR